MKSIIAATDPNTDIGDIIEQNSCCFKVSAVNIIQMINVINELISSDFKLLEANCEKLLMKEYLVDFSYQYIINIVKYKKCKQYM